MASAAICLIQISCTGESANVLGESVGILGSEDNSSTGTVGSVGFDLWDPTASDPNTSTVVQEPNSPDSTPDDPVAEPDEPDLETPFAGAVVIEPDDYADGAVLSTIDARVTMSIAGSDNEPHSGFEATANDDGFDFAPTGDRVFGQSNVPFFNSERRLRLDFTSPVRAVRIDFAGGTYFETETGRLDVFDEFGAMIGEYVTSPLGPGESETMYVVFDDAQIARAIAYIAENEGSFGRLDNLQFATGE